MLVQVTLGTHLDYSEIYQRCQSRTYEPLCRVVSCTVCSPHPGKQCRHQPLRAYLSGRGPLYTLISPLLLNPLHYIHISFHLRAFALAMEHLLPAMYYMSRHYRKERPLLTLWVLLYFQVAYTTLCSLLIFHASH